MIKTSAIYGFNFTREFSVDGLRFFPVETNPAAAKQLARDLAAHHLTGVVSGASLTKRTVYDLEALLSFIEHLDVIVTGPRIGEPDPVNLAACLDHSVSLRRRNNGGGAVIGSDANEHCRDYRKLFIELALRAMRDDRFCTKTRFRPLLFKCVEAFRQREPFIEITYFLLISGLEAFCRASQGDFTNRNAAVPIARQLESYGFNVRQDSPNDLRRSISTYLHIRNALFHQGELSAKIRINDGQVEIDCLSYLFNLSMLVSLTIMKAVGFDDGRTNWESWVDRQLHK